MESIKKFNGLNGVDVSRSELMKLAKQAHVEEQFYLENKIKNVLQKYKNSKFNFDIQMPCEPEAPASMLDCFDFVQCEDKEGLNGVSPADVYKMITNKMIELIKAANKNDYVKKWKASNNYVGSGYAIPFNFVSKKRYRGVNFMLLTGFELIDNPFFLTFKQVKKLKGTVKKGAKGHEVVYYTRLYVKEKVRTYNLDKFMEATGLSQSEANFFAIPIFRYYNVFNGADVEGIDFDLKNFKTGFVNNHETKTTESLPVAEAIVENYPSPKVKFLPEKGDSAFYVPSNDTLQMPKKEAFDTAQDYYRTLFHELAHSTGNEKRLARKFGRAKTKEYAFEELVAEFAATFISAEAGFLWHTNKNHAAYLKGWNSALTFLENDTKFLMRASTAAQKATDFILQFDADGNPLYFKDLKKETIKKTTKKVAVKPTKKPVEKVVKPAPKPTNYGKKRPVTRTEKVVEKLDFYKKYNIPEDEFLSFFKSKTGANDFYKNYKLNEKVKFEDFYKDYLLHLYENKLKNAIYSTSQKTNITIESELITKKISLPKVEADKFLALKNIVSKDDYRPNLKGVYIEEDSLVATDAIKLVVLHKKNNENVGKIKDFLTEKDYTQYLKDGRERLTKEEFFKKFEILEYTKYPNYQAIIPNYQNFSKLEDVEKWLQICKNYIEVAGKNAVQIIFKENNNEAVFNPKVMYDVLEALYKGGNKKVKFAFAQETKIILIRTETKDYGLVMQVHKDAEYLNVVFSNPFEIKNAHNVLGLKGFSGSTLFDIKQNNIKKKPPKRKTQPLNGFVDNVLANVVASAALAAPQTLAARSKAMANKAQGNQSKYYKIDDVDIAAFLGDVEIKNKESVAITLAGGQGSGKTRFCFQLMNAFAQNYKVGHASIEEHPESQLYFNKVRQYIKGEKALNNITAPEINTIQDVHRLINDNDVVVIDSFSKLQEMQKGTELDKDFRKKYNGKLFIIIYQLTTDGNMRGGAKSQFDGDIICDVVKERDFKNNYIIANKNRYQNNDITELKYNVFHQKLQKNKGLKEPQNNNFKFNINVN